MNVVTTTAGAGAPHQSRPRTRRPFLWWALAFLAVLTSVLALRTWVVTPFEVVSDSMAPTLPEGSTVLVERVSLTWQEPDHQDLVLFDSAEGPVIKRVVGTEGDTVRIEDAVLQVDGVPVDEP